MSDSKFLKGTLILTVGTFFIKFLGMIYVIPFYHLVGVQGGALYNYGYNPYTIFLSIATAGVPMAVSKFVSKYNALGQYRTSRKMFTSGLTLLTITGILSFLILYFIAPYIAPATDPKSGISTQDIVMVIRMTSVALIIVPMQSIIRGFFQGHQSMGPTTMSQLIEQIVRIIFLLGACYLVINVFHGSIVTAVGWSTFAAFVGAAAGLGILIWYWFSRKKHLDELLEKDTTGIDIPVSTMFKELLSYALPFVFVGMAIPLYTQIDNQTFNYAMRSIGLGQKANEVLSVLNMYARQLSNIPVSLATAFSLTLVPAITKFYVAKDHKGFQRQVSQIFQLVLFLTAPAAIGMAVLGYPLYRAFFSADSLGGMLLTWCAPNSIFFALYSVSAAVLQGINKQKHAVLGTLYGLIVKAAINIPLIKLMQGNGSILATEIGFTVSIVYICIQIKRQANISFNIIIRRSLLIMIFVTIMAIAVKIVESLSSLFLSYEASRGQAIMILVPSIIVGMIVYMYLSLKSGLMEKMLGKAITSKMKRIVLRRG